MSDSILDLTGEGSALSSQLPPTTASARKTERAERLRASIRALVRDNGLTIADLSRRIGLNTPNVFYNLLHGRSSGLSHDTLVRLCDAFPGVSLDQIVGRRPDPELTSAHATLQTSERKRRQAQTARDEPESGKGAKTSETTEIVEVLGSAFREISRSLLALRVAIDDLERDVRRASAALQSEQ